MFSFIETRLFTKLALDYLSDDAYASLQEVLMRNPEAGSAIPGSGGGPEATLGSARSGQTRWVPCDLLRAPCERRDLVNDVPEERNREHIRGRAPADQEGSREWLNLSEILVERFLQAYAK
jgi:hypothetical protein